MVHFGHFIEYLMYDCLIDLSDISLRCLRIKEVERGWGGHFHPDLTSTWRHCSLECGKGLLNVLLIPMGLLSSLFHWKTYYKTYLFSVPRMKILKWRSWNCTSNPKQLMQHKWEDWTTTVESALLHPLLVAPSALQTLITGEVTRTSLTLISRGDTPNMITGHLVRIFTCLLMFVSICIWRIP